MPQVLTELRRVWDALVGLSLLGRVQVLLLIGGVATTMVMILAEAKSDPISKCTSVEFLLATIVFVCFTVTYENQSTFVALVLLQLQQCGFLVAAMIFDGNNISPGVRWAVVTVSVSALLGYAALQVSQRGTWGWHAYRSNFTTGELLSAYSAVQRLHATLLLAEAHAVLAATCAYLFTSEFSTTRVVHWCGAAYTILSAPMLARYIHREDRCGLGLITALFTIALGAYVYAAYRMTLKADVRAGVNVLGLAELWIAVAVNIAVLGVVANCCWTVFGSGFADRRKPQVPALISAETVTQYAFSSKKARRSSFSHVPVVTAETTQLVPQPAVRTGDAAFREASFSSSLNATD